MKLQKINKSLSIEEGENNAPLDLYWIAIVMLKYPEIFVCNIFLFVLLLYIFQNEILQCYLTVL